MVRLKQMKAEMNRMLRIIPDCFPLDWKIYNIKNHSVLMKFNISNMGVQVELNFMNEIQIYRKCMAQFNHAAINVNWRLKNINQNPALKIFTPYLFIWFWPV